MCTALSNVYFLLSCYIQAMFPAQIHSARGLGTMCAISFPDSAKRDKICMQLRERGEKCVSVCVLNMQRYCEKYNRETITIRTPYYAHRIHGGTLW